MVEHTQIHPVIDPDDFPGGKEYFQRKVLEQHYFSVVLRSLIESTADILTEVKGCLHIKSGSFSTPIPSTTAYTSWCSLWQDFEPVIQSLEDDLMTTRVTIDQWESREEDRGEEKPRWTRNDERKYRAEITRIRRDVKRQTRKLEHLHADIKSLRESCSNALVKAREELSFRSEQNIATFTYVTVVFLPLGFVASLSSVLGTDKPLPPGLVPNLVTGSVVALAITVLALVNANALAKVMEKMSDNFGRFTADAMETRAKTSRRRGLANSDTATDDGRPNPALLRNSLKGEISWSLIFWVDYIFIEVPARMIALACRALVWRKGVSDRDIGPGLVGTAQNGPPGRDLIILLARSNARLPFVRRGSTVAASIRRFLAFMKEVPRRTPRVLLGFLLLPVFISAWVCRVVFLNILDTLVFLGGEYC